MKKITSEMKSSEMTLIVAMSAAVTMGYYWSVAAFGFAWLAYIIWDLWKSRYEVIEPTRSICKFYDENGRRCHTMLSTKSQRELESWLFWHANTVTDKDWNTYTVEVYKEDDE